MVDISDVIHKDRTIKEMSFEKKLLVLRQDVRNCFARTQELFIPDNTIDQHLAIAYHHIELEIQKLGIG